MVAKVISGKTIKGALNYNESKVREGQAACIRASGFILERNEMSFYDKFRAFAELTSRNRRSKTNAIHISLNFDLCEKLSPDKLTAIADAYMKGIGFGRQPYLVYEHFDAAHPHVHILTTNIQDSGKRIPLHNLGRNQSETTRKDIEKEFGLVPAESKSKVEKEFVHPVDVQKAVYGKSATKRSISNVVRMVTSSYKYTSLPELNAVLRQYNIMADRGKEGTVMFDKKGLLYSMLDSKGQRIGIPIKASAIYGKPTLPFLERQYAVNEVLRQPAKDQLKKAIEWTVQPGGDLTKEKFVEKLSTQGVYVLFRSNEEGRTYGITFVDNKSKTVFNGSDLGKAYTAKAILERLTSKSESPTHFRPGFIPAPKSPAGKAAISSPGNSVIADLFHADSSYTISAEAALRLKRKRKRSL